MKYRVVLCDHVVQCPNCCRFFVSPYGTFACWTISCPVCGCEVLR